MLTQAGRPARLTTPLGADKLVIERMVAEEGISRPFKFSLDLLSLDAAITHTSILRKPVSITLEQPGGEKRFFHGIVSRFAQAGRTDELVHYRAEVVPWLWLLGLTRNSRIFQNKTVPDILQAVLSDGNVTDVSLSIDGTFEPREYCVQYGESSLDFFQRLCEDEGIFYFFKHEAGKHTLVVANKNVAMPEVPAASVMYAEFAVPGGPEVVTRFDREDAVHPGKVAVRDYHFCLPDRSVGTELGSANEEVYDYPVPFAIRLGAEPGNVSKATPEASRVARLRLEMEEALQSTVRAQSNVRAIQAGHRMELSGHFGAANGKYFVLSARHVMSNGGWRGESPSFTYDNDFVAVPFATPFRPQLLTPRPRMHGTQTAVVVGPAGEEIYTDKYSRVKVQFHWDRVGKKDAGSSCWMRVASTWAGKQWGVVHIPRIGQEVVVDFLDGDPDQPIIIGSVYNAEQMPPYALPDNKTQSGLKSRSSLKGETAHFNELRFEDKKDAELIYFHAQKDYTKVVEDNEKVTIQHDRTVELTAATDAKIGNDTLHMVKGDQKFTLDEGNQIVVLTKGNQTITLTEGDYAFEATKGNGTVTFTEGNVDEVLEKGNRSLTMNDGNRTTTLEKGNDETSLTNGNVKLALSKGNATTELTSGNHEVKVTKGNATTEVTTGDVTIKSAAGAVTIEAMKELTLKVGTSTVTLKPTGIEMKFATQSVALSPAGLDLKGLKVSVAGTAMTEVKGPMTQINGTAMLKMQGAITMIN